MKQRYQVHNVRLVGFEPQGGNRNGTLARLRFKGASYGYGINEITITMNADALAVLKEKLGPRNITRFAPACVDCTVAQAKHFKFCPWVWGGAEMTDGGQHIHNAGLANAEMWGLKHRLTFSGVSCGHGHRLREVTVFMDEGAIKKMIGILELGMKVPSCHQLAPEPTGHQRSVAQITRIPPYKFEGGEWDPVELLKDIKGALPIKAPPCPFCKHWNPGRRQWGETIDCCTKPDDEMWGDFSCYKPKEGTE